MLLLIWDALMLLEKLEVIRITFEFAERFSKPQKQPKCHLNLSNKDNTIISFMY